MLIGGPKDPEGMEHKNEWFQWPGMAIGTIIGAMFGFPGGGIMGRNAGLTFGDAIGGNWDAVGWDMSQNLPNGQQERGMKGIRNAIVGPASGAVFYGDNSMGMGSMPGMGGGGMPGGMPGAEMGGMPGMGGGGIPGLGGGSIPGMGGGGAAQGGAAGGGGLLGGLGLPNLFKI